MLIRTQMPQEQRLRELIVETTELLKLMTFAGRPRAAKEAKTMLDFLNRTFRQTVIRSALHREL
jgi:hypothetical protein